MLWILFETFNYLVFRTILFIKVIWILGVVGLLLYNWLGLVIVDHLLFEFCICWADRVWLLFRIFLVHNLFVAWIVVLFFDGLDLILDFVFLILCDCCCCLFILWLFFILYRIRISLSSNPIMGFLIRCGWDTMFWL